MAAGKKDSRDAKHPGLNVRQQQIGGAGRRDEAPRVKVVDTARLQQAGKRKEGLPKPLEYRCVHTFHFDHFSTSLLDFILPNFFVFFSWSDLIIMLLSTPWWVTCVLGTE